MTTVTTVTTLALVGCSTEQAANQPAPTTASGPATTFTPTTVAPPTTRATTTTLPTTTTTSKPLAAAGSFTTPEGWTYSYTVEFEKPTTSSSGSSGSSCVPPAPPGHVNLPFVLTIHNDSADREAPTPAVYAASNLAADGSVRNPTPTNVTDVEGPAAAATPAPVHLERGSAQACGRLLIGSTTDTIGASRSATYKGVLGGAPTTVPPDTTLAFRAVPSVGRAGGGSGGSGFVNERYEDPQEATDGDWLARYDGTATSTITDATVPTPPPPSSGSTTPSAPASTGRFTTAAGWTYSYTVTFAAPSIKRSPGRCVPPPPPGKVNLPFTIELHNDEPDREAPLPGVGAATNLSLRGTILNASPTGIDDVVGGMYDDMALVELADRTDEYCDGWQEAHTKGIAAGRSKTYEGTIGAVPEQVPAELTLVFLVATPPPNSSSSSARDTREASWVVRYQP